MRVVQVGCGKMSVFTMRYVLERGGEIVGAYDINEKVIGKDISEIIGGEPVGVTVEHFKDMDISLKQAKADIAVVTTQSLIASLYPTLEILAKNHVNAVSIGEELFYAWDSNPHLAQKIDDIAKAGGVTITGSGYQDVSWGSMVTALAATAASIKTIHGISSYNLEDYGLETASQHGAGLTMRQFEEQILSVNNVSPEEMKRLIEGGEFMPSYMWPVNGWVASALGLHATNISQRAEATTYVKDLNSKTLGRVIPKGDATGLRTFITTETKEGITIITECIGKVFAPEDVDINEWRVEGEPDMRFVMENPATVEMTCACAVNRLPDVVSAKPGYVTSEKLPNLRFHLSF
jgi:4-hydroxy-tetrahydrodipicolinate reductase